MGGYEAINEGSGVIAGRGPSRWSRNLGLEPTALGTRALLTQPQCSRLQSERSGSVGMSRGPSQKEIFNAPGDEKSYVHVEAHGTNKASTCQAIRTTPNPSLAGSTTCGERTPCPASGGLCPLTSAGDSSRLAHLPEASARWTDARERSSVLSHPVLSSGSAGEVTQAPWASSVVGSCCWLGDSPSLCVGFMHLDRGSLWEVVSGSVPGETSDMGDNWKFKGILWPESGSVIW